MFHHWIGKVFPFNLNIVKWRDNSTERAKKVSFFVTLERLRHSASQNLKLKCKNKQKETFPITIIHVFVKLFLVVCLFVLISFAFPLLHRLLIYMTSSVKDVQTSVSIYYFLCLHLEVWKASFCRGWKSFLIAIKSKIYSNLKVCVSSFLPSKSKFLIFFYSLYAILKMLNNMCAFLHRLT